jgi:hypothetical protein
MADDRTEPLPRRSFLSHAGITAAALGMGVAAAGTAQAQSAAGAGSRFQPARHSQDDWLDQLPGKHRLFLDALTGSGTGDSLLFASNFLNMSKTAYSLNDNDNAVVICLRHFATPYAWNDAVWAKYGAAFTEMTKLNDPKTGKAPTFNLYTSADYGMQLPNLGTTLDSLIKRGVHFAVCDAASHFIAGMIAQGTKGDADAIYKEFTSSTLANAHYVAAGIVAVNRSQERGYTVAHCG